MTNVPAAHSSGWSPQCHHQGSALGSASSQHSLGSLHLELTLISIQTSNLSAPATLTQILGPYNPNFQQNLQVIGTMSPDYFLTDMAVRKSKEILLTDKIPIKSACLGKPGALGGCKATSMALTHPCQAKHFSCCHVFVLCKLIAENERTEAVSDSTFVCFPFIQNLSRIF